MDLLPQRMLLEISMPRETVFLPIRSRPSVGTTSRLRAMRAPKHALNDLTPKLSAADQSKGAKIAEKFLER